MRVRLSRRSFMGLGLAAAVAPASAASPIPAAFLGQSGEPRSGRFVIGLLSTTDEAGLRAAVETLRARTSYRRVLRWRSTDRYRLAFARGLIDAVATRPDTRFSALDIDLAAWPGRGPARDAIVGRALDELLASAPPGASVTMTDTGDRGKFGALVVAAGRGQLVTVGNFASDDLLQAAGFLAGLAASAGAGAPGVARDGLLAHLKARLAVGDIGARAANQNPAFRVRTLRL